MGWCRAIFVMSIVCATIHSKTLTPIDNVRNPRQLDFGECCPCPKPRGDVSEEPLYPVQPIVDDCPCRNRAADSEGASSILSPAFQALRPFMRSASPKFEPEPLLKPEVGLASSVLKTLQEVTNEEYEDALARDATRSVAKALETDLSFLQSEDTPGSIINIILNPKDAGNDLEIEPEASHIQETRCIHPLGSTHNNYDRNNFKSSLFREPSSPARRKSKVWRNDYDMDNEASEIKNTLQKPSNGYVMKSLYKPKESTNSQETLIEIPTLSNTAHKISDHKLSTIVDNLKKSIQSNAILNKLTKKELNTPVSKDGNNTPITTITEQKPRKLAGTLENLQNIFNNVDKPINMKNLLKLKDVEFVPKRKIESDQKIKQNNIYNDGSIINASISDDDKIVKPQDNAQTKILDAVPSSSNRVESESKNAVLLKPHVVENNACEDVNVIPSENSIKTKHQILNNMKTPELEEQEIIDETYNSSTEVNLIQNESFEKVTESANNNQISMQNSRISSEYDMPPSKDEPTFKSNQSFEEKEDKNILPLIRADIIKSFKNFKKVNDDMQEKLRHNLQDVLQVVDTDKKKKIEDENLKPVENINKSKSITEDDLQNMSDSILNESNIIQKLRPSIKDANVENKLDNCVPTEDDKQNIVEEIAFKESSCDENVTPASTSKLNNTPNERDIKSKDINKSNIHFPSNRLSDNSRNKNILNLNTIDRNINQLEQKKGDYVSNTPEFASNTDISDERILDKNSKDFTDSSIQVRESTNDSQSINNVDLSPKQNTANQGANNEKELKTEMSEINETDSNISTIDPSESIIIEERKCLETNSNDMNVQASEAIGNRVTFDKPNFNILKPDRTVAPKFSLGSGLSPYSARLASPHSLDRDTIRLPSKMNSWPTTFKTNNMKNDLKNLETAKRPTLRNNKRTDLISKPLDELHSFSDNFKSRTDESLKNLNKMLGSGAGDLKSNHLYKDVLNNADDIKHSLSRAHNDLNSKLQKLHSDWTDKIHTFGQRADTPLPTNRVANDPKNIFNRDKKMPLLGFEKPRTESNIMKGKPLSLLNDEKFKFPQLLSKSLYKAPSLSERKANILTTTKRPLQMFTTKRAPKKEVSLKFAPKPALSRTIKDAIDLAKSDKLNSKMRDMKTLSSNIKPLRVKSIPETRESLEDKENIQRYKDITAENSSRYALSRYSDLPLQLKAEEFSVLKKLLDGIRSSQSDMIRNDEDYGDNVNETLQAPSQNIENFQMPENTLKENVSYKCRMVCTKDNK